MNTVIFVKEISMEFYQFFNRDAGLADDDVSLGFHDLWEFGADMLELLNPGTWIQGFKNEFKLPN